MRHNPVDHDDIDALMAEELDAKGDALWEQSVREKLGDKEFERLYPKPATPPDFTKQGKCPDCGHEYKWAIGGVCQWKPGIETKYEEICGCTRTVFTEQARQLVQSIFTYGAHNELREYEQLVIAIAAALAEAATQGQVVGIERAAETAEDLKKGYTCDVFAGTLIPDPDGPWHLGSDVAAVIRTLSPDPSYLNQVRNEAATAALEQERERILDAIIAIPITRPVEDFAEARDVWDYKADVLAAIGDDKE